MGHAIYHVKRGIGAQSGQRIVSEEGVGHCGAPGEARGAAAPVTNQVCKRLSAAAWIWYLVPLDSAQSGKGSSVMQGYQCHL